MVGSLKLEHTRPTYFRSRAHVVGKERMWVRGRNDGGEGEKGEIIEGGMMVGKWRKECGHPCTLCRKRSLAHQKMAEFCYSLSESYWGRITFYWKEMFLFSYRGKEECTAKTKY
jgi:hypothetical protein